MGEVVQWTKKRKVNTAKQIMAPFLQIRLRLSLRAFAQKAADLGGPFITIQGRRLRRLELFLCLLTCFATRVVHPGMAYGLFSDSFFNAFHRIANQKGLPREMLSDNGGNFFRANRELREFVEVLDQNKIC